MRGQWYWALSTLRAITPFTVSMVSAGRAFVGLAIGGGWLFAILYVVPFVTAWSCYGSS